MIEMLIAMGVMFSALLVLAYTMLTGLSAVGFSRQRTEATALANQALEQIRALPANELYMSSSDVAGDSQLVGCGSKTCFNGRAIAVTTFGSGQPTTPLTTHIVHTTGAPGNTPYTIESYLTTDPTDTTGHTLVATVQVSWGNSQVGGVANHVQVETKIYNNQFIENPPTVPTFTASANTVPGTITVTGTVLGSSLLNVSFNLPSTQAGMNGTAIPGTTNVGASGSPVSASIAQSGITAAGQTVLNTPVPTPAAVAQSLAGTGPQGPVTGSATPTLGTSLTSSLGLDLGAVTAGSLAVGSVENTSAFASSTDTATNGLGYGQATSSQTGPLSANVNVSLLSLNVLNLGLVSLVPTGNSLPDQSAVTATGSASDPAHQTYNGAASQSFTSIDVLTPTVALAGSLPPLIALTGFKKSVAACAGPTTATCSAAAPVDTGTLSILGGTPISIQSLLAGGSGLLATVNGLLLQPISLGGLTTVGVSGTGITLGSTPAAGATTVGSPLTINLNLTAQLLGISLLNVTININLGSVSAAASYTP